MAYTDYDLKSALPNKSYNEDGTVTDLLGNSVQNPVPEYNNKPALPNKWLNPDGTYSTLLELISGAIDTELFVIVEELPSTGLPNKIYLLVDGDNLIEYIYVNDTWDPIGMVQFDISQYSTTEQMNAAIAAALNSAKAYTDTKISNIKPQIVYWDGDKTNLTFWNTLLQSTKTTLLYSSMDSNKFLITFIENPSELVVQSGEVMLTLKQLDDWFYANTSDSYSSVSHNIIFVDLKFTNGVLTSVGKTNATGGFHVICPDRAYARPFIPTADGHPATKKYVDDSITTNITNVLGGSY